MPIYTIYHNPRCSKSRQTLELLKERGVEPEVVEYLKTPLSAHALQTLSQKLRISVVDMMRTKERAFEELDAIGTSNRGKLTDLGSDYSSTSASSGTFHGSYFYNFFK